MSVIHHIYEQRFVPGLPADAYHNVVAFSSSWGREAMRSSPKHAHARSKKPQTPSMVLGSALHAGVLEPEAHAVAIAPDVDRRTKEGKEAYARFQHMALGRIVLTHDAGETYRGMLDSIAESSTAQGLLNACDQRELSGFTVDPKYDVLVKARFDALSNADNVIVDVKTTSGLATRREFERSVGNYGYGFQAALYVRVAEQLGMRDPAFVFLVVETEYPHGVGLFHLGREWIDMYSPAVDQAMGLWAQCSRAEEWVSYPDVVQQVGIPAWALKGLEEVAA